VWNYRVEFCKAGTNRIQFDNSTINLSIYFVNNLKIDINGSSLLKLVFGSGNRIIAKEFLEAQSNAHLMCFLRSPSNFIKKNDKVQQDVSEGPNSKNANDSL